MSDLEPPHIISKRIEPHRLGDRVRGKLLWLLAWPRLIVAMRQTSRRTELWIGDSHAMCVNREVSNAMFMCAPDGQLILRVGARLMYSIGVNGFPPRVGRVAWLVRHFGRDGALVPIFMAGEIDVRVHLPKRAADNFEWVDDYVARCLEVAQQLRANRVGFMAPTPPVNVPDADTWFPITGTIDERIVAHRRLREALAASIERESCAHLLDLTDLLADSTGGMPLELTTDGAHTNLRAIQRIRNEIRQHELLVG